MNIRRTLLLATTLSLFSTQVTADIIGDNEIFSTDFLTDCHAEERNLIDHFIDHGPFCQILQNALANDPFFDGCVPFIRDGITEIEIFVTLEDALEFIVRHEASLPSLSFQFTTERSNITYITNGNEAFFKAKINPTGNRYSIR